MENNRIAERGTCGAAFRPPRLYLGALVAGFLIDRGTGWRLDEISGLGGALEASGYAFLALGLALMVWAMAGFRRAGTPVPTIEPATALVTSGAHRISRNPIYLGVTLLYLGLSITLNSITGLALLPGVLLAMHFGVILREEAYMRRIFGADYADYARRTSRWLGFRGLVRKEAE